MVECGGPGLVPGVGSCTKLPHSLSAGEVSRGHNSSNPLPPPTITNSTKMLAIRVRMLDDNVTLFQVQAKALGKVLFEQVCKQLNLLEADYFGLEYQDDAGIKYWLDLEKCLQRQVGLSLVEPLLQFCVKFYPADPTQLEEEYTRYLFCLQVKRDLAQGHIQCNDNTAALMASYIVQAECGDFVAEDYPDPSYLSTYKFVQHQDKELERKIMENHKKHIGQSPAEADLNLLETARRCELYGVKMHPAKDHDGVALNLAVAHMGILVFINYNKINSFSWAKIRKISFKRKKFLIKLHAEGYGYHKDTVEFFFDTRNECKNLWKKCVEHHGFFRCSSVKRAPRQRARVLSRGSSFRYSGRTQKQIVEYVRENYVKRQTFQRSSPLSRSQSFRQSSSVHSSVANVGSSISAHPLIPLANASIVSMSCGSMAEDSQNQTCHVDQTTVSPSIQPLQPHATTHTGLQHSYKQYNTASSQTDIVDVVQRDRASDLPALTAPFSWQRSASCKELRKPPESFDIAEKPANRNFIIAGSKTPSFDHSNLELETKVYSSSYPGTTSSLSTESPEDVEPGGSVLVIDAGSVHDFSHDDLSHDSYELLERDCSNFIQNQSSLESSREGIPNDDDLFVIDSYKDDVEKRLGYVEPRYRDIGFSEFNEKCKLGFARNREQSVEFQEFDAKCKPGLVIGYDESDVHYPVERTKSDPYVSDFWRVAKQHRRLYHQKSFDLTPDTSGDDKPSNSKSTADIPYSLTVKQYEGRPYECRSPSSPKKSPSRRKAESERKRATKSHEKLSKTKQNSDLNSQDSGLSMSVGTESTDEINEIPKIPVGTHLEGRPKLSKKNLFKNKSEDAPKKKGSLSKAKALSADSGLKKGGSFEKPPVEVIRIDSEEGEGLVIRRTTEEKISVDTSDPDVIIVEYRGNKRRAFQKRGSSGSKDSFDKDKSRESSFDYPEGTKGQSEKMKDWQNSSRHDGSSDSYTTDVEFRRERYSKEVKTSIEGKVVRESKEEREMKKQKSDERVETKEQANTKEVESQDEADGYCTCSGHDLESKIQEVEKQAKEIEKNDPLDLITPFEEGLKLSCKDEDCPVFDEPSPIQTETEPEELEPEKCELTITEVVLEVKAEVAKQMTSPEKAWKKFDELSAAIASKRERSPILFARLGFSEGSVFAPSVQSPSSSRRAKSLDAPVVSLHRLPPITSFSSKDDTVDDDDEIAEEGKLGGLIEEVIHEEDSTYLSSGPDSLTKQESPLRECLGDDDKPETKHFFGVEPYSSLETSRTNLYSGIADELGEQEVPRSPKSPLWQKNRKYSDSRMEIPSHSRRESFQSLQDEAHSPPPERRPSTRSERIDSFKNTKNFSVDLWTSDENDVPGVPRVDICDADMEAYDDAFADPVMDEDKDCDLEGSNAESSAEEPPKDEKKETNGDNLPEDVQLFSNFSFEFNEGAANKEDELNVLVTPPRIPSIETSSASIDEPVEVINISKIPLLELTAEECKSITKMLPEKRSFDDEPSTTSSLKPDSNNKLKPFSFESSGSSSLEEGIFPLDDSAHFADEEEGSSNSNQDDYPSIGPVGAELILSGYTGGVFGLSRTLSRISERSTTSEQERSDYEDDISTKPSSRSMSVEDESMMSSDRQPSLSSDPSTNLGLEERPLPPLPHEKLDFKIPPPLLPSEEEWPSPPNSNFETPVITHSHVEKFYMDIKGEDPKGMYGEIDSKDEEDDEDVSSDSECENKTLHEDDAPDSSAIENTLKICSRQRKAGNSSDNSLGVSDFSSSTGTTIKHCHYHSNTVKSDDSSLADFGSSLSTEMLATSRKNSDDSGCHKKRKTFFLLQRSFDDYDSPYTESDESSKASHNFIGVAGASGSIHIIKKCPKQEGRRKCCQHEMIEKKMLANKSLGRSKCYSYYSLARSPPSDGSSSSLDLAEPPLTPNTIPRVSKRRRHVPPSKRRPRILPELEVRDGVAIVEKSSTRSSSPELVSNGPLSNIENNNSIMPVSPTSKMNGGYISSEYASPELSPMKTIKEKSYGIDSSDSEVKKKRYSNDRAYFIAKEFLMTERTYRKDLEVINLCVREELGKAEWDCIKHLLSIIDPLHDEHCHLLKELELRLAAWENRGSNHHKLADLLLAATHLLPLYEDFLQQHQTVLIELNKELADESFKEAYSNFEKIKLCYLPITRFILKPIQRLLHYEHLVDSLINHYGKDHADFSVCEKAKLKLEEVTKHIPDILRESENYIHLIELSRDISGFEGDLTEGDRQFIRQGSLAKFSQRKGYQQRMFFLFSDLVLYSNLRGQTFRLHGQMSLKNLTVQERVDNPSPNSFIIYTGNRALTVSANSQQEKDKWLEDLTCAIESSKENPLPSVTSLHSLKCSNSMEDVVDGNAQDNQRATPQRSNTTVHVCWHRNTSICLNDLIRAAENQLSGYLLRKFKNSNGWQKLWVVFTNFCLFFYKTFQDEAPLASLPLLGYSVTTPIQEDGINKDFVFKLQFKNHIYFFRAESEYTFGRWMEVIGSATQHSGRLRIFSRKESDIQNNI